jgi:hypothetical protein
MLMGMDYLGGAKYPNTLLRNHPAGWAAGFFDSTFGRIWGVVDKLAASGKCPLIKINGPWTAHRYVPAEHDGLIFLALRRTIKMAIKHPSVKWQFAPVCENDVIGRVYEELLQRCKVLAGKDVEIINSRGTRGREVRGFKSEVHGNTATPAGEYQYSYDGTNVVDADVVKDLETRKRAGVFFLWHPAFNLKYKTKLSDDRHEPKHVIKNDTAPPKERDCKPTPELIASVARLGRPINGTPKLSRREIWKSHADRNNTPPAPREYKPVFITPVSAPRVELRDGDRVIAVSSPRSKFVDDRFAYRFSDFGYQISDKVLDVYANGKKIGSVNPAFRAGDFRS